LHSVKKRSYCAPLWGRYRSVTIVNQPEFFLIGSVKFSFVRNSLSFLLWSKTHHFAASLTDPTFWAVLGCFSGTAKRGWHQMPPNLTHIVSKKLPSFWCVTCPEAICGYPKKLPVFFCVHNNTKSIIISLRSEVLIQLNTFIRMWEIMFKQYN
jgi:hypothetical protein